MEIDKLTLIAGADIPVPELKANLHQPTINEIAILGEERFYSILGLFNITAESVVKALTSGPLKNELERMDLVKSSLESLSDFEILLQVLKDEPETAAGFESVLSLILPQYSFSVEERIILGFGKSGTISITEESFLVLREVVKIMFCLNTTKQEEFNPVDDKAKAIADKIQKARERVRASKGESKEKTYILANYISSLGIGVNALNILNAVELTVYQLFNQMERYGLYVQSDYAIRAAMAGAKGVEQVDWLKQL
jgi:hypothetical protein